MCRLKHAQEVEREIKENHLLTKKVSSRVRRNRKLFIHHLSITIATPQVEMALPGEQHTAFIGTILGEQFRLPADSLVIKEIEQAKNNHVYLVELANPTSDPLIGGVTKPFTSAIPANTSRLVFRIPKDGVSLEDSVRVRNEVAFLALGRDALVSADASLIPRVYGWEDKTSPGSGFRWILEEWKEGEALTADDVEALDEETQRSVLDQVALLVKSFQEYRLPDSSRGFGGLTFDENGTISNTASTIPCGGPFATYADFLKAMCKWQLEASDRSTHLKGWRDMPALRKRLEALFSNGLDELLAKVPEQQPTLVHADLCEYQPTYMVVNSSWRWLGSTAAPNTLDFRLSQLAFRQVDISAHGRIGFRLLSRGSACLRVSLLVLGYERHSSRNCGADGTDAKVAT